MSFAHNHFRVQKRLDFQGPPLPMALVLDLLPSRLGAFRSVPYSLRTAHPTPLMGANPLQGPLEGVGPENRDFFVWRFYIGPRAVLDPRLIWFGYMTRYPSGVEEGCSLVQMISICRHGFRGGGGSAPCGSAAHPHHPHA
jgi:hypothetical protein